MIDPAANGKQAKAGAVARLALMADIASSLGALVGNMGHELENPENGPCPAKHLWAAQGALAAAINELQTAKAEIEP